MNSGPSNRTSDRPHPALGQELTPSPTARRSPAAAALIKSELMVFGHQQDCGLAAGGAHARRVEVGAAETRTCSPVFIRIIAVGGPSSALDLFWGGVVGRFRPTLRLSLSCARRLDFQQQMMTWSCETNMKLFATDVFTPNDFPEYTYVTRTGPDLEKRLADAIATPKMVVSISGPSKSGKTVLIEKTVGKDNLIIVSGAKVGRGDELWSRVVGWMGGPTAVSEQTAETTAQRGVGEVTGKAGRQ
jgi:hypothetical protein